MHPLTLYLRFGEQSWYAYDMLGSWLKYQSLKLTNLYQPHQTDSN
jgi:hypothetical protein